MKCHRPHHLAFNAAAEDAGFGAGVALNFADDAVPEWVALMPRGPELRGLDGRSWRMDDPRKLVEAFNRRVLKLPFDINHGTFIKAPKGEDAPAVGWIEELAIRDGIIHGRVSWNARGEQAIRDREYRYVSPVFKFDAKGHVVELTGAGLVNTPNFTLPALNAEDRTLMKDLFKKLGLADTATEADAIAAVDRLQTAANAQKPDLSQFVPRADYDLALNRANDAERKIADDASARLKAAAEAAVDQAIKDRKIAPVSRAYHLATCADQAGYDRFAAMVKDLPALLPDVDLAAGGDKAGVALNAEQKAAAEAMGLDEKAFAEFLSSQK